jgi:cytoskeletal protein RodZ
MDGNIVSANTKNVHRFALQQKARGILFLVVIVVPVFIAGVAYLAYQDIVSPQDQTDTTVAITNPESTDQANNSDSTQAPSTEITPPAPPSVDTPAQTPGSTQQTAPTKAKASPVPDGLKTALNSIETNGIKGSAYVSSSFDTSNIPDGTSVTFDRSSWQKTSNSAGSIQGTVYVYGQPQNGSVTFAESGGVWRATGYTLN